MLEKLYKWNAPKSLTVMDIQKCLEESSMFSFTVTKERREPFRHTSIELQFDREAFFTISRRIPDKTSLAAAGLGAEAVTYIEHVKQVASENCGTIFQSKDKKESKIIIEKLLADPEDMYNLYDKNCRDHVTKTVLNAMQNKKWRSASKQIFLDFVEQVRQEDRRRVAIIAFIYFIITFQISSSIFLCSMFISTLCILFDQNARDTVFFLLDSIHSFIGTCNFCKRISFHNIEKYIYAL